MKWNEHNIKHVIINNTNILICFIPVLSIDFFKATDPLFLLYQINIVYIVSRSKLYDAWIVYIIIAYDLILCCDFYVWFHPEYYFFLLNAFLL